MSSLVINKELLLIPYHTRFWSSTSFILIYNLFFFVFLFFLKVSLEPREWKILMRVWLYGWYNVFVLAQKCDSLEKYLCLFLDITYDNLCLVFDINIWKYFLILEISQLKYLLELSLLKALFGLEINSYKISHML